MNRHLDELYFTRMASSIGDKEKLYNALKSWIESKPEGFRPQVLEVGAGGSELSRLMVSTLNIDLTVIDNSEESINHLQPLKDLGVEVLLWDALDVQDLGQRFDVVVCSSVLHEIYSYGGASFPPNHPDTIPSFFEQLSRVFVEGREGLFLIRDGVKDVRADVLDELSLNTMESVSLFSQYLSLSPHVSNGLLRYSFLPTSIHETSLVVEGSRQSLMEAAYTITWGQEALPREVQELYGVYSLVEYQGMLEGAGFQVREAYSYLQPGYPENLEPDIVLKGSWPDSNGVIVATIGVD